MALLPVSRGVVSGRSPSHRCVASANGADTIERLQLVTEIVAAR